MSASFRPEKAVFWSTGEFGGCSLTCRAGRVHLFRSTRPCTLLPPAVPASYDDLSSSHHRKYRSMTTASRPAQSIVVIGGGIIGSSIAYYLSRAAASAGARAVTRITLIEASSAPAPAASGKAGGFLALGLARRGDGKPGGAQLQAPSTACRSGWWPREVGLPARSRPGRSTSTRALGSHDQKACKMCHRLARQGDHHFNIQHGRQRFNGASASGSADAPSGARVHRGRRGGALQHACYRPALQ
ncbi:hypothetical protein L1887_60614 [Cichorium endivia]|nr:hypothetical protein L1887_60614 [Cichorium endivia]